MTMTRIIIILALMFTQNLIAQELPTIQWNAKTLRLIEKGGSYGRMTRLNDNSIAAVFDRDGKMWIRTSRDEGFTFADAILVAEEKDCWLTNADLLALASGELLYFWNERPLLAARHEHTPPNQRPPLTRPFLIRMSRSADHGKTWSAPQTLYTAGPSYQDGCWEPAAIQLPSGEIQVFFANEFPYQQTAEQEISRIMSSDDGNTWSDAKRVSFRKKYRDGMPSPLLLASGNVVLAIEDNGLEGGGERFKPAIVDATTGQRWAALKEPLNEQWYAGAPFLRQLPGGQTLLSFQQTHDGTLRRCRMIVAVGDSDARRFSNLTEPFPPPPPRSGQMWNSLFVRDASTITAITGTSIEGLYGIWAIDGRIAH